MRPGPTEAADAVMDSKRASRHGLARVLSKRGICSRTEAARWVSAGRVSIGGWVVTDPEFPVIDIGQPICIDGVAPNQDRWLYLALNKPRGLVTTTRDERGRDTVYSCLKDTQLPWLAPVGRLDKASEGLLLFSNDPRWAAAITQPGSGPHKVYHVHVACIPDADMLAAISRGAVDKGDVLSVGSVTLLRSGDRNAWLEITLGEGRNRHIRRLLQAHGVSVLRLIRVAIGPLALGDLKRGAWRMLSAEEAALLAPVSG